MSRLRTLLLALLGVALAVGVAQATAQSKSLIWERLDVDIAVQPNGDLRITETNVIRFTEGTFRFGFRDINQSRLTGIDAIAVLDEDGAPMQFETTVSEKGDFRIKYYFNTPAERERRTFKLIYTVQGATRYYPDGDQVYWKSIFADRNGFAVQASRTTVSLPANSDADKAQAYGARYKLQGGGERTVVFEIEEPVPSGQEFEVRVQFPHGAITGSAPPWQQAFDEQRRYDEEVKPRNNITALAASLLLFFGGPALALVLWVTRGRDPNIGLVAEYLTEPPAITPALAGTLIDEQADLKDIIAAIFDLASRGVIVMSTTGDGGLSNDYVMARGPNFDTPLRDHERRLLDALELVGQEERQLSSLKNVFYSKIGTIKNDLYQDLVTEGLYVTSPGKARAGYSGTAGLVALLTVVGGCFGSVVLSDLTDFAICLPIGGVATALAFFLVARHMPTRTRKGAELRMRVEAFKRYLQNIEKYVDLKAASEQFAKYLPWAIAFGLDNTWVRKFAAVNAPMPGWYFPGGFGGYGGQYGPGYPRSGGLGSSGGSNMESPRSGDVSDAARQGRGIGDIERGAAMGMAGFERDFAGMFESFGRTMESRPAPKPSSSSGGWSSGGGGGWSGGGGGGGGGSGGGGGGFG